jgi:hypothetical protein
MNRCDWCRRGSKAAPFGYVRMSLHQIPAEKPGRPSAVMRLKMVSVILSPAGQLQQFDGESTGIACDAQRSFILPEPESCLEQLALIATSLGKFASARIGLRHGGRTHSPHRDVGDAERQSQFDLPIVTRWGLRQCREQREPASRTCRQQKSDTNRHHNCGAGLNASHPSGTPAKLAEPIAVDPAEQTVAGLAPCLRMSAAFQHPALLCRTDPS